MAIKNLIIFGTRPEAIKMAPLVHEFRKYNDLFQTRVCVTAQHREMLDQVLEFFEIQPDYDLNLMKPNQSLYGLTAAIITEMEAVLQDFEPDNVYVHGDTTTTMAAGLAAFYSGARVCHVEAGLRTFDKHAPFPEEINRSIAGVVSDLHFAPTETSRENLLRENTPESQVVITGNTVIDALKFSVAKVNAPGYADAETKALEAGLDLDKRIVLVTGHRRENHGQGFVNICKALRLLSESHPSVQIVYPVHLNPNVKGPVYELLSGIENIRLIDPLSYPAFVWLMARSYMILTDSGGVQEEAPSLGKPVLVMRETTERPEAVEAGTVILVGTNIDKIVSEAERLLNDEAYYSATGHKHNPYGDGTACAQIVNHILKTQADA